MQKPNKVTNIEQIMSIPEIFEFEKKKFPEIRFCITPIKTRERKKRKIANPNLIKIPCSHNKNFKPKSLFCNFVTLDDLHLGHCNFIFILPLKIYF